MVITRRVPSWIATVPLAHRGLHDLDAGRPENSLVAFEAAVAAHVGVELDVRLSADGVVVVSHDDGLLHQTGRDLKVSVEPWETIHELSLFGTAHRIPTLAEALDVLVEVPVMVEVKNESPRTGALESAAAEVIQGHRGPVSVASFNPRTIGWFRRHAPDVLRGQTGGGPGLPAFTAGAQRRLSRRHAARVDYLSWSIDDLDGPVPTVHREAGVPVIAWTVTSGEELDLAREHGDNVIFEGLPISAVSPESG